MAVNRGFPLWRPSRHRARAWKFIVTTYLTTNKESELAARVVPFLGSLMQGVSAILFVFILAVGFNLASGISVPAAGMWRR
jgi:ABC-type nickel/cobalt efflux system permease component RcnA